MVFKGIKRFWRIIRFFIKAKKIWSPPRQSDVLIYDAVRPEALLKYLNLWHPEVMHIRGDQINMRVLFSSFFRSGARLNSYVDCFIEKVQPRLVVTIVDNNAHFYTISKKYPEVKTLFVQNGLRTFDLYYIGELNSSIRSKFFVDYMLVFGECVGAYYKRVVGGEVLPMGSILNNSVPKECRPQPGVVAFISQWQSNGFSMGGKNYSHADIFEKPGRVVLEFLVSYAEEKNKRLMIISRYSKDSDLRMMEKAYFRGLLGSEPEYLELDKPNSSYHSVDTAEVTVAIDSTLGVESLARGNKTAIFSIRTIFAGLPAGNFGWPGDFSDEGLFWTNKPDPNCFSRILDYLFEVSETQWREDLRALNVPSIITCDPDNTILKSTLEKVLGVPPASEH